MNKKIVFVGDVHGKTERYCSMVMDIKTPTFQIGDMGLGFQGTFLPHRDKDRFIRGNHDDPAVCKAHPNYAGEFGYDPEYEMFFMGGAWSIDWAWRRAHMLQGGSAVWWADEELSAEQLAQAKELYIQTKPLIVATHECPASVVPDVLPTGFRGEKLECIYTRTSQTLDEMFKIHQPKLWVFGHYHIDRELDNNGTKFICLNELSTLEVDLQEISLQSDNSMV